MKTTAISILVAAVLIGGAIVFSSGNKSSSSDNTQAANNVSIVDGKQIITINAKGGYSPRLTTAKADMPTIIKVATNGTFDCSSALTIPSLGYRTNLPPSGSTDVKVPPQKAGTIMRGLCAMGMYNFSVIFN
ncbi:MAG: cupredoxin domain-containing protein [bacterium]|nr:cupredoxin domain-containing protein [bacterium]